MLSLYCLCPLPIAHSAHPLTMVRGSSPQWGGINKELMEEESLLWAMCVVQVWDGAAIVCCSSTDTAITDTLFSWNKNFVSMQLHIFGTYLSRMNCTENENVLPFSNPSQKDVPYVQIVLPCGISWQMSHCSVCMLLPHYYIQKILVLIYIIVQRSTSKIPK